MRTFIIICSAQLALTLLACAPPEPVGTAVRASAPLGGKADAADQADRGCQIVLRSFIRQAGDNGYLTQCIAGVCNWVWAGSVEVADGMTGTVRVLYRRVGDPSWWQVDATLASNAQPGFKRYELTLHEHMVGPDASEAELAATSIELMPFLELADGTRLFDHNRRPGDFDNYVLDLSNGFAVHDEGAKGACASEFGRFSFLDNWTEYLSGTLRQGAYLVLDYDLDRLPKCRGSGWDIVSHVQFAPGGQLVTGSVQGQPTGQLTVKIPTDATAAAIWFRNHDDSGCQAWDSNYGANYEHDVWPAASDPRCKDIERWTKINSDVPYASKPHCLAYTVDEDHDADSCELYLSGIGDGYVGHYGIPNNWVEAYITVGPLEGKLLGAGMLTLYRDTKSNLPGKRVTFARQVAPDTWQTGFIYLRSSFMGNGFQHAVEQMAFFIDVKRPTGEVVRLWQSRHGANYGWNDAFGAAHTTKYIAYGSIKYAGAAATIFDARNICK